MTEYTYHVDQVGSWEVVAQRSWVTVISANENGGLRERSYFLMGSLLHFIRIQVNALKQLKYNLSSSTHLSLSFWTGQVSIFVSLILVLSFSYSLFSIIFSILFDLLGRKLVLGPSGMDREKNVTSLGQGAKNDTEWGRRKRKKKKGNEKEWLKEPCNSRYFLSAWVVVSSFFALTSSKSVSISQGKSLSLFFLSSFWSPISFIVIMWVCNKPTKNPLWSTSSFFSWTHSPFREDLTFHSQLEHISFHLNTSPSTFSHSSASHFSSTGQSPLTSSPSNFRLSLIPESKIFLQVRDGDNEVFKRRKRHQFFASYVHEVEGKKSFEDQQQAPRSSNKSVAKLKSIDNRLCYRIMNHL